MENRLWYFFEAEDRHSTASYYFQANSEKEAEAKARILYGSHDPLYGENLSLADETTNRHHESEIKRLTQLGEDDFDSYLRLNKEKITKMIEVLGLYL